MLVRIFVVRLSMHLRDVFETISVRLIGSKNKKVITKKQNYKKHNIKIRKKNSILIKNLVKLNM